MEDIFEIVDKLVLESIETGVPIPPDDWRKYMKLCKERVQKQIDTQEILDK